MLAPKQVAAGRSCYVHDAGSGALLAVTPDYLRRLHTFRFLRGGLRAERGGRLRCQRAGRSR